MENYFFYGNKKSGTEMPLYVNFWQT